jgi:hypothetical protein
MIGVHHRVSAALALRREVLVMKCPKCGYTSFPYLESCGKCGHGLAEPRAALGIYALRPDPPDLLLAYQAASMEVTGGTLTPPVSTPGIDLGTLEGIELEIAEAEPSGVGTHQVTEPSDAVPDLMPNLMPTLDREAMGEEEIPLVEPNTERPSSQDMTIPQSLDLSGLGDITLEIDHATDLEGESPESTQTPSESAAVNLVYDLDLDEDLDGLTLGGTVHEAGTDEDDEATEYTLEIEEDLEFEVDELELEQDDEVEDEDDDR